MKQAYLIIAHHEFEILQRLISILDSDNNIIFVHIDAKVKKLPHLFTNKSILHVLDQRIDVRWGHVSQIECELLLFESALKHGPFYYYHIISGVHLPIRPMKQINEFYERYSGYEIMHILEKCKGRNNIKLGRFNIGIKNFKHKQSWVQRLVQLNWVILIKFQKIFGIFNNPNADYVKSENWLSLTQDAVSYIVNHKNTIIKKYFYTLCGDEYFIATELTNANFKIFNSNKLLYQVWNGESPTILTMDDYNQIINSDCLFARKFSSSNIEIVDALSRQHH